MTRLRFTLSALSDLNSIFAYIAPENPAAAGNVLRAIHGTASHVAAFPGIGHPGRLHGTREFSVRGYPYVIVYHVDDSEPTIIAVLHGARDAPRAMGARRDDGNRS